MHGILGNVTIRDEQAHEAASMYYLQGQTMETIARHLGVSRSSVSRLLTYARNSGLVRISVAATPGNRGSLSGQINEIFGVHTSVVPVHDIHTEVNRLHNVARVAAERLVDLLKPGDTLGIAWGNTTSEVTRCLPPGVYGCPAQRRSNSNRIRLSLRRCNYFTRCDCTWRTHGSLPRSRIL